MSNRARASTEPDSCCGPDCASREAQGYGAECPVSRSIAPKVDLITVKALLTGKALRRLNGKAYRFCSDPDCDVVYFDDAASSLFRKDDLTVPVGLKEGGDFASLCYCFGYTMAHVRRDIETQGMTEIPAIITAELKAGHCACEVKNPQGSCCLGAVSKAVRRAQGELADSNLNL